MTDLADVILQKLNQFEELHGRQPDLDEMEIIQVEAIVEAENQWTIATVDWIEA